MLLLMFSPKRDVLAQVPFTTRRAKCARLIASSRSSSELRLVVGLRLRSCLGTLGAGLLKSQRGWLSVIARVGLQVRYSRLYNTCRYIYVHAGVDTNTYIYIYIYMYTHVYTCMHVHVYHIHRMHHIYTDVYTIYKGIYIYLHRDIER